MDCSLGDKPCAIRIKTVKSQSNSKFSELLSHVATEVENLFARSFPA